jgi:hypothetical protein
VSQPLLEMGHNPHEDCERTIAELEHDLEIEREKVREARAQMAASAKALARLRSQLQPWYAALRSLFGELDAAGVDAGATSTSSSGPLDAARYAPWKEKYRGQTADAIDILVKYEAGLSRKQLASFLKINSGSGSMSQIIFKLNKADLIEKDGSLIRLRRI